MTIVLPTDIHDHEGPPQLDFPENDPAYIEALRETFQFQGVADDTRDRWLFDHLAEDY